jgi:hypothetical protein
MKKYMITHARQRAKERYNLNISNKDIRTISYMINGGIVLAARKINQYAIIYCLHYKGKTVRIVYNKNKKCVSTFLPVYDKRILNRNL